MRNAKRDERLDALSMKFGREIALTRTEKQMTQSQLAELCGIAQGDISRLENGSCNPQLSTMMRVADALDCSMEIRLRPQMY